jgi:hypothetical protein
MCLVSVIIVGICVIDDFILMGMRMRNCCGVIIIIERVDRSWRTGVLAALRPNFVLII